MGCVFEWGPEGKRKRVGRFHSGGERSHFGAWGNVWCRALTGVLRARRILLIGCRREKDNLTLKKLN